LSTGKCLGHGCGCVCKSWKTNQEIPRRHAGREGWQACSACAGDYQDPDRSAWQADEDDADVVGDVVGDVAGDDGADPVPPGEVGDAETSRIGR